MIITKGSLFLSIIGVNACKVSQNLYIRSSDELGSYAVDILLAGCCLSVFINSPVYFYNKNDSNLNRIWVRNLALLLGKFYEKYKSALDTLTCPVILMISVGLLYWLTMPKTLSWGWRGYGIDSPELVTAAKFFSVPHPPGYPLYTGLLGMFSKILPIGDYAFRGNLFSVVFSCLCVFVAYLIAETLLCQFYPSNGRLRVKIAAFFGAITLAVAPIYWSVSTIAEVYTLHSFLVALQVYLCILLVQKWKQEKLFRRDLFTGLLIVFTISLCNHLTALAFIAPITLFILFNLPVKLLVKPFPIFLGLVFLLIYLYLPIRASVPVPFSWGQPDTIEGFMWMIRAVPYQSYVMAAPLSELDDRTLIFVKFLFNQFNIIGLFCCAVGIRILFVRDKSLLLMFASTSLLLFVYSITYLTVDAEVNFIPALIYFSIWSAIGIMEVATTIEKSAEKIGEKYRKINLSIVISVLIVLGCFVAVPVYNTVSKYEELNFSDDRAALENGRSILADISDDDVLIVSSEKDVFTSWYARYADSASNTGIPIAEPLLAYGWYIERAVLPVFPNFDINVESADIKDVLLKIVEHADRHDRKVFTIRPIDDDRLSLDQSGDMYLLSLKSQE